MSEIKRCPFCNGEAHIEEHKFWNGRTKSFTVGTYGVRCLECGVSGTQFHKTKEEAIEQWNTRKPMERIVERLEERTKHLKDCTKYGNKNVEQQEKSYSTVMLYEVADLVEDLIEIVKEVGGIE